MDTPDITTPSVERLPRLVDAMVSGFSDDPLYVWLYPDPDQRRMSLTATFDLMLRAGLERGLVRCTDDHRAVAIWTAPGDDLLDDTVLDDWVQLLRRDAPDRVEAALAAMSACASHAPTEPHWVLHLVVVHADHQGCGLGTALLRSTLGDVDATGAPAYLESSNAQNVRAYQRLGFAVVGEVTIAGGPIMRPMARPPVPRDRHPG